MKDEDWGVVATSSSNGMDVNLTVDLLEHPFIVQPLPDFT